MSVFLTQEKKHVVFAKTTLCACLFDIFKYVQNAFQIKVHMHPGAETSSPLRFSYLHINDIT
jgi:hypothetical protein